MTLSTVNNKQEGYCRDIVWEKFPACSQYTFGNTLFHKIVHKICIEEAFALIDAY